MMGSLVLGLALIGHVIPERRAVVVSTDCGAEVDDQWALAHMALSPRIDLKGIVTSHSPGLDATGSARKAEEALRGVGLERLPRIVPGSDGPLPPGGAPRDNAGVRFLLESARGRSPDDRLAVVMIGSGTDVASALGTDPSWADRVTVVAMAFDGWPEGGDPWNVKNDVAAWRQILESRVPLVVGDAAVTRRRLAHDGASARAAIGGRGVGGPYLCGLLERWIAENRALAAEASGRPGTWVLWDEVTTAYLLGLTAQETRPRPRLRGDRTLDHADPKGTIAWITDVDADRLWADLGTALERARAPTPR